MVRIGVLITFGFLIGVAFPSFAQRGKITKPTIGTTVLDPNQDGFVSKTTAGFSNDGYYVDEFETPMFGIPIFEDGEALNDIQAGAACGTTELTVDSRGFTAYGVLTTSGDLVFRFRIAKDRPSVEAYTILIDTDKKVGADDPNSNSINPGFEIDITLIKNKSKGVYVYDIDGVSSCPGDDLFYPYDSHFQIAVADIVSCGDPDYFYDYYVPFSDLVAQYGLTDLTELRFVALTNVSATCALAGKISDIGGVNDTDFAGCNSCAFLELATNQCPTSLSNLCPSCEGFLTGVTPKPGLNDPLKGGEQEVSGTSVPGQVFVDVFNAAKTLVDQKTTTVNPDLTWEVMLDNVLQLGDSVTARAQGIGLCESGSLSSGASFTIVIQNIPPVVTGTTPSVLTYTENDPPLPIDDAFALSDADDIELESATVSIIANFTAGQDILSSAVPPSGLSTNYNAGSGTFTITGTASIATYQALLRTIGYSNTSENPITTQRMVRIVVNDGLDDSNLYDRPINVVAVNDPPLISGILTPVPFAGGTITIDNTMSVTDVDNTQLTGAVISVSGNYLGSEDALQFTNQNGITGLFNSVTGILTLSGTSSVANYAAALASIAFVNNNGTPSPLTRRISYIASDGTDNSTTFNVFIDFPGANGPPVIVDGGGNPIDDLFFVIDEDNVLEACINAIDPDGDPVAISTFSGSTGHGAYVKTGDLCFSFTPTLNFHGLETSDVVVCDQSGLCDQVTVHITVNPVNDAPSVDVSTVDVDGNQTTEICISVSDVEGDPAVVSSGSAGIGIIGDPIIGDLCLDYTPPNGFDGPDEISVTVCDVSDPTICSTAVIPINVIAPPNNPPETFINGIPGAVLRISTLEDTPVLACFESVDPDGDDISLSSTSNLEGGGSLSLYNDIEFCFEFIPASNFNGKVTWEVVVCDDRTPSLCGTVTIEIDVLPVNDPPTAVRDSLYVIRNVISGGNVLDNDFDIDGDLIHVEGNLVKGPDHGTALVNSDGSFSYQSDKTFRGIDSLVYQVCDNSNPPACDEGTLVIVVDDLPLRVYEGFTPNGDNSNEYWRIEGIDYYTDNEVKIFDRFNNLIFEMKGYDNETKVWKGDANRGIAVGGLPDGIYFYTIDLGEQGSKKLSGFVVLKRK